MLQVHNTLSELSEIEFPMLQELHVRVDGVPSAMGKPLELLAIKASKARPLKLKLMETMPGYSVNGILPPMFLWRFKVSISTRERPVFHPIIGSFPLLPTGRTI